MKAKQCSRFLKGINANFMPSMETAIKIEVAIYDMQRQLGYEGALKLLEMEASEFEAAFQELDNYVKGRTKTDEH